MPQSRGSLLAVVGCLCLVLIAVVIQTTVAQNSPPTETVKKSAKAPRMATEQQPVEAEHLTPMYANFARVTGSPEELVLDFGLNPQPFGDPAIPVKVSQRVVMNYYTAKRLSAASGMALQRHEQAFGILETDVNKRTIAPAQRPAQ